MKTIVMDFSLLSFWSRVRFAWAVLRGHYVATGGRMNFRTQEELEEMGAPEVRLN